MSGKDADRTGKPEEWTEERNREAARTSVEKAEDRLERELEEGLEDSFPASDPLTATRPAAAKEDAREGPNPAITTDEAEVRDLVQRWIDATRAGDMAAVLDLMTDDVVFSVTGAEPFGREAFAAAASQQQGMRIDGSAEVREVKMLGATDEGQWALARAYLQVSMTTPGADAPVRRAGYTLSILNKGADGKWRIARDANMLAPVA